MITNWRGFRRNSIGHVRNIRVLTVMFCTRSRREGGFLVWVALERVL